MRYFKIGKFIVFFIIFIILLGADFARRYPTDTAMQVYTPTNPQNETDPLSLHLNNNNQSSWTPAATLVTNLNADLWDGSHIGSVGSSIIPTTNSTVDLGSSAPKYWANVYANKFYVSAGNYLTTHGTSGISIIGDVYINSPPANSQPALWLAVSINNAANAGEVVALGGYSSFNGATGFTATTKLFGLMYSNFSSAFAGNAGNSYLHVTALQANGMIGYTGFGNITVGSTAGIRGYAIEQSEGGQGARPDGLFNVTACANAYGGYFSIMPNSSSEGTQHYTVNVTTGYGIYVQAVPNDVTYHKILTEYGIYVEKPINTGATNRYQLVLGGNGTGSGIWFNDVSSYARIYASAASTLDLDIAGTTELQLSSTIFKIGSVNTDRVNFLSGSDGSAPSTTATPVFTAYYGGNTNALGDPTGWLNVQINGTARKIPYY